MLSGRAAENGHRKPVAQVQAISEQIAGYCDFGHLKCDAAAHWQPTSWFAAITGRLRNDDCTQPGNLFRLMSAEQQQRLFSNIAAAMQGVPEEIVRRQLAHFTKADPAYGEGVAMAPAPQASAAE